MSYFKPTFCLYLLMPNSLLLKVWILYLEKSFNLTKIKLSNECMNEWMKTVQNIFLKKYFLIMTFFNFGWTIHLTTSWNYLASEWFCFHSCVDVLKQDVWVGRWHKKSASGPLLHIIHHITFTESVSAHLKC